VNATPLPSSLEDWLVLLEKRHPVSIDLGLERCGEVWRRMGSPYPGKRVFVVAGTNGKGSTVATLCAFLGGLGHTHGSYTSPHVYRYNERVQVNGRPVSDAQMVEAFHRVERARGDVGLSYFEFGTLAAFDLLAQGRLDFAVMEVGLGGRLDAVNLLDSDCAVITPIGLDHQEYLGPDRDSIAREKAGIMRAGRPVVCGDPDPPAALIDAARRTRATLKRIGADFRVEHHEHSVLFRAGAVELVLPEPALPGPHQVDNLATALAALLELLPQAAGRGEALAEAVRSVRVTGRLERVSTRPAVWIDVGHNPLAARAVASALRHILPRDGIETVRCVLGMLVDKDAAGVAHELAEVVGSWYCAGVPGPRGQGGRALAERMEAVRGGPGARAFDTVESALDAALNDCSEREGVLVFGSFLTAAAAGRRWAAAGGAGDSED
jgi:dihydrofolate synthase/folylpolyglutamate synthase